MFKFLKFHASSAIKPVWIVVVPALYIDPIYSRIYVEYVYVMFNMIISNNVWNIARPIYGTHSSNQEIKFNLNLKFNVQFNSSIASNDRREFYDLKREDLNQYAAERNRPEITFCI